MCWKISGCARSSSALFALAVALHAAPPLLIRNITVIDGTGAAPRPAQSVLIRDGRIAAVGKLRAPPGADVLEGSGKFLIPGLWDMHTHLAGLVADPVWSRDALLPLLIANGITGVRDMGGDLEALLGWRRAIAAGSLMGPQIVAGGPMLIARGKPSADQIPISNEAEARAAVRNLKQRGADFIKIISLPSRESFFALADEAKQQHIPFEGHVPDVVSAAEAADAGMRSIEHAVYSHLQPADAEAFLRNHTWFTPTLYSILRLGPAAESRDDPQLAYVPQALRDEWDTALHPSGNPEIRDRWARQFESDLALTRAFHAAGIRILAGSDSLDRFVIPGSSLHEELALLVRAGLTPMEALQSATRDAARFLNRESEVGTIQPGRRADLVLLEANPLLDIRNTAKISAVVVAGVAHDRIALGKLRAQAQFAAMSGKR
jgi:imidazolonepropionase-like amidohydrolase